MSAVLDVAGVLLLGLGLLLTTAALVGLLRGKDVFAHLHAAGLATGPAPVLVLLAAVATGSAEIITSALLVIVFLLVTSPLSSHAIAHAARRRGADRGDGPPSR